MSSLNAYTCGFARHDPRKSLSHHIISNNLELGRWSDLSGHEA